jgi:hypothetical protein
MAQNFFIALQSALREEVDRAHGQGLTNQEFVTLVCERVVNRLVPDGDDFHVNGIGEIDPPEEETPSTIFAFGVWIGNLLAWKRGFAFFDFAKPKQ